MYILECEWSDIGSWDTISKLNTFKQLEGKNTIEINSTNNHNIPKNKSLVFVGVDNLIVVSHREKY